MNSSHLALNFIPSIAEFHETLLDRLLRKSNIKIVKSQVSIGRKADSQSILMLLQAQCLLGAREVGVATVSMIKESEIVFHSRSIEPTVRLIRKVIDDAALSIAAYLISELWC